MFVTLVLAMETFRNPVFPTDFPDPFIVQHQGKFIAYGTHGGPGGFRMMTSSDLVRWEVQPPVGKPSWSSDHLWAPEVFRWGGKWYFLFSAKNPATGKRDLAVSVGHSPMGPFRDHAVLVPGTSENSGGDDNGAIDPTIFVEGRKPYLLYIREAPPRALKIVELANDFSRVVGPARDLLFADRPHEQGILDAPTLIKREGMYWLFYSSGWFQSNRADAAYRVGVASSRSLFGPYTKREKPVLAGTSEVLSPGHQTIFRLGSGEWWIAYHGWSNAGEPRYGQNPAGRTLRLDRLLWEQDGPVAQGPTISAQPAPRVR